jgi:hypothetical protein
MGRTARVKSIDALQSMSAALECFRDDAGGALDDLEMEIRRAVQWIGEDCRQYWKHEVQRAWDRIIEAKRQLEHAQMFRRAEGQHSPCVEEEKAVVRAKRRLELAESKVQAVTYWAATVERAVNEFRGIRSHLVNWLDADYPKAVAALGRMISALETYVRLQTPGDEHDLIARAAAASAIDAEASPPPQNDPEKPSEQEPRQNQDSESGVQGVETDNPHPQALNSESQTLNPEPT